MNKTGLDDFIVKNSESPLDAWRALPRIALAAPELDDLSAWYGLWQQKQETAQAAKDLPEIDAKIGDLATQAGLAWNALTAKNQPPRLFTYARVPSLVEADLHGAPLIQVLDSDLMRYIVARCAKWFQNKRIEGQNVRVDARPPLDTIRDMLATPHPPLPVLDRVVEAPFFTASGKLIATPGYDPESRVLYHPRIDFSQYPSSPVPSHDHLELARELLLNELLGDFPFVSQADKAAAVGLLVFLFVRELIVGPTPLHLIDKPCPGTGAGLLIEVLLLPATGRPLNLTTEGRDEDEMRKRITAMLVKGSPYIVFDNLRGKLDSAALSAAITASQWEDRLLGQTRTVCLPVRCVWVATGNNPTLSGELSRRAIRIRLDAQCAEPWRRTGFRHPDLLDWAVAHRPALVWAALTLVQAWLAAGRPLAERRIGTFESWCRVMGGILQHANIPGFLDNLDSLYKDADAEGAAWRVLLAIWWTTFKGKSVGVHNLYALLDLSDADGGPIDLGLGEGNERSRKTRFGRRLNAMRDRIFEIETTAGSTLKLQIIESNKLNNAQQWQLRRVE
jgi:hypothetical protein